MKFKNQKGQAVLIVLLSLSVVLIVVMFVVSRSITDISLSSKEENSLRAFSAAEAGIERALVIGSDQGGSFGNASFDATVTNFAKNQSSMVYPVSLKSGEAATFWFTRPLENGLRQRDIKLCWGDVGTPANNPKTPAIELAIYYTTTANDLTTLQVARATFDPNASRASTNNFTSASSGTCTIGNDIFQFYTTSDINLRTGLDIIGWNTAGVLQFATVKILYNDTVSHKIGLDVSVGTGNHILPSQGKVISSAGSFENANRSIQVYQLHPIAPIIFENAIFSTSGITQ